MIKIPSLPVAIEATNIPSRTKSVYPEPFATLMQGREKRALGDFFAITRFGVNLTRLIPGSQSALLHCHSKQEEFIYILEGEPTLVTEHGKTMLKPGMCAGFTPSDGVHQLCNETANDVIYLEVGDRAQGDEVTYPADDLSAEFTADGCWQFKHKDGRPY
jgi:uncharacterized cupin superfamily protein